MELTVGTRGSKLSLVQTKIVVRQLSNAHPNLRINVKIIRTLGDRVINRPLLQIKEKGIFEKEIDKAVLRREVDFAVHSMKDVPTELLPKIIIAAVPKRDSPYDVLVSRDKLPLEKLPPSAVIGTSSPRREAELRHIRPDLNVKPIRGNVDTRVRKLLRGLYDAVILAEVGLERLNMQSYITEQLPFKEFTPAPGQGALAVVTKEDNDNTVKLLKSINHPPSMAEILAERAFIQKIGGGCKVPLGAIARAHKNTLSFYASVLSPDGKMKIQASKVGDIDSPEELGVRVAQEILKLGADELIQHWRKLYESR